MKMALSLSTKDIIGDYCDDCENRFKCMTRARHVVYSHPVSAVLKNKALVPTRFDISCQGMLKYDYNHNVSHGQWTIMNVQQVNVQEEQQLEITFMRTG